MENIEKHLTSLLEDLNDEQKSKIKNILSSNNKDLNSIIKSIGLNRKSARKMMKKTQTMIHGKGTKPKRIPPNKPCPCGSGIKYKKCCLWNNE